METLYRYLTEPRVVDGKIIAPTAMMMRAGKALAQIAQVATNDRRLAAEKQKEALKAHDDYEILKKINHDLRDIISAQKQTIEFLQQPIDFTEYNEAMNNDRE